jgi:hypothetical protein
MRDKRGPAVSLCDSCGDIAQFTVADVSRFSGMRIASLRSPTALARGRSISGFNML